MRRRRKREEFRQPTLVPLADMLCNTLGIVIFILVFTVLATGNAVTHTAFPIEKTDSGLESLRVVCIGNRICPVSDDVIGDLAKTAKTETYTELQNWKYEDSFCKARLESLTVCIEAKPDTGDTASDVDFAGSALNTLLRSESAKRKFVYFEVYPDGAGAFAAARIVARKAGYYTGWITCTAGQPVRIGIGGGGGGITPGFQ